jgi:hypothetical protein
MAKHSSNHDSRFDEALMEGWQDTGAKSMRTSIPLGPIPNCDYWLNSTTLSWGLEGMPV